MENKNYLWFVECHDKFTLDRVCDHFDIGQYGDRVSIDKPVVMSDGLKRKANLIQLSANQKNILIETAKARPFQFTMFKQEGKGQIRFAPKSFIAGTPLLVDEHEGVSFERVP